LEDTHHHRLSARRPRRAFLFGEGRAIRRAMSEAEVLTRIEGRIGRLTLNRPRALHALNLAMCEAMTEALLAWRDDPAVEGVLLDHAGERGFCAGGDIRMIAESGAGDAVEAKAFFHAEYRLNHLMFVYPKPITAIVDGVVMGGGVGISEPADVRIATERTTYAMPETGIGLFPDVGGGWFLPRLPGETGTWLALTGARLKAADTVALGIHTHFAPAERIDDLKAAILSGQTDALSSHAGDAGPPPLAPHREAIDRLFAHDSVEAIFDALETDGSDWALQQLATLRTKSPQSLKVTLRQLRAGRRMTDFAEVMAMEYRLGGRIVRTHDFQEGVRAVIVDKDNAPQWSPSSLEDVSDAAVDAVFAPLPPDEEWSPLI
jgi:enoyl-CoA hydratase